MLKPFAHQSEVLAQSQDLEYFALFWEMGTGKTKTMLDNIAHLAREGKIDAVLIIAPNGVHRNWIEDEIPKWLPSVQDQAHFWESGRAGTKKFVTLWEHILKSSFPVVAMSYEGFYTTKALAWTRKFFAKRKVLMILDESTKIKAPNGKRARKIVVAGKRVAYRRILTGTPVSNSPFDVYMQMKFLNPTFWKERGFRTHAEFKACFGQFQTMRKMVPDPRRPGMMKEQTWEQIVTYRNLRHLHQLLAPHSSRVLKENVLDLPPKLYTKRYFELSKEQRRVYSELRDEMITFLGSGELITVPLMLTVYLRLQQITSNYIPTEDEVLVPIGKKNPRLECLADITEELAGQAIIWCRFREDINQVMNLLGDQAVRYDGKVDSDGRVLAKNRFQAGEAKYFVANPAVGATGLTLTAANTVIYYSNSFKLEDRLQSEDRAHRIGQTKPVQYIDIIAPGTIDTHIVSALRKKVNVASVVTGDQAKEWI